MYELEDRAVNVPYHEKQVWVGLPEKIGFVFVAPSDEQNMKADTIAATASGERGGDAVSWTWYVVFESF